MKSYRYIIIFFALSVIFMFFGIASGNDMAFEKIRMSFTNFITCELTRNDTEGPFEGKKFNITSVNLFDARYEGDILVVSGTVKCWVVKKHEILYVSAGIKKLMGHEKVYYLIIRDKDFSVLASQLFNYPYKERCPWDQYWIKSD